MVPRICPLHLTGAHVHSLLKDFDYQVNSDYCKSDPINYAYDKLVNILQYCASVSLPMHQKVYYEFWWDQELDLLKEESIKSHKV